MKLFFMGTKLVKKGDGIFRTVNTLMLRSTRPYAFCKIAMNARQEFN
jgi:hypothetical protein